MTFDDLLKAAGRLQASAPYIMAHCDGGYTTNIPVADLVGGKGMIATRYEGLPILPSHGGPARLLVPHLYFWKSSKWVRKLRFMEMDERGFWESLGYHNYGDPWNEQRYDGDETADGPERRLEWQLAEVRKIVIETPRAKSIKLRVPSWQGHLPGQHVDIRLTADDDYQAQRSYSVALAPEDELLNLNCGARRRLFSLDHCYGRPALSHRTWIGRSTADGNAPAPRPARRSRYHLAPVLIKKSGKKDSITR